MALEEKLDAAELVRWSVQADLLKERGDMYVQVGILKERGDRDQAVALADYEVAERGLLESLGDLPTKCLTELPQGVDPALLLQDIQTAIEEIKAK